MAGVSLPSRALSLRARYCRPMLSHKPTPNEILQCEVLGQKLQRAWQAYLKATKTVVLSAHVLQVRSGRRKSEANVVSDSGIAVFADTLHRWHS
jgi:hypothetical protein